MPVNTFLANKNYNQQGRTPLKSTHPITIKHITFTINQVFDMIVEIIWHSPLAGGNLWQILNL
jgi:hypothetical protein